MIVRIRGPAVGIRNRLKRPRGACSESGIHDFRRDVRRVSLTAPWPHSVLVRATRGTREQASFAQTAAIRPHSKENPRLTVQVVLRQSASGCWHPAFGYRVANHAERRQAQPRPDIDPKPVASRHGPKKPGAPISKSMSWFGLSPVFLGTEPPQQRSSAEKPYHKRIFPAR